ncbi:diguanylate cyclase [Anaerotignum sp. MB30-C6]|uniref:diguanylate cyclase n=1 Tax=Anaerotignum sp. MB30-C6 TaxID=3070814 RepID=UPI0027DDC1E1|nr:diguanylate cyclase [Anaerotignum sp. MB30-C6]WMI82183.1 diguanylate cyclase [Anaerotignum sp. MB30-C6]
MRRAIISLFSMAMVICLLICGISVLFDPRDVSFNQEKVTYLTDGWFYQLEDGQEEAFKVPCKIQAAEGQPSEIYRTFYESIPEGVSLGFRSSQQEIVVSLGDEIIYSYGKTRAVPTMPDSPASAWHIVELPQIHSGQTLKIASLSPYRYYHGKINEMMLGSKSAILFHIATRYFPAFFTSALVLIIALALTFYGLYIYKIRHSANFLYIGVFALLLGTYFFAESKFAQFFFGKALLPYQMVFLSTALIPIPMLLFFSSALQPKEIRLYELLCCVTITNFFAMIMAQSLGFADFYEWLPLSHSIIFLSMLLVLWTMAELNQNDTYRGAKNLFLGISVFVLSGMLDIFFFYAMNQNDSIVFLQVGTLLSLIIITKGEINQNVELIQIGLEAAALKKAAYTDALTQIGNRYAFDLRLEELAQMEAKENIDNAICIIDVDGLKFANDTYGHWMGDQLICCMAQCLQSVFHDIGMCFRIGGDEFAVILRGKPEELQQYSSKLKEAIIKNNMASQCNLSASWGIAFQKDTEGNSIYEAFQIADVLMYQDKESKKEKRVNYESYAISVANKAGDR